MADVVTAAKADVSKVETEVKTEVVTVRAKVQAWVKAHIPHAVAAVAGFAASHFSVISYLVHKIV
jgi:hypothetical protein